MVRGCYQIRYGSEKVKGVQVKFGVEREDQTMERRGRVGYIEGERSWILTRL